MADCSFTFFGVRGSYPVPGAATTEFGGNTSSLLIEAGNDLIIIDAGTGLINIGNYLRHKKDFNKTIHIFLTHLHIDHILGFPFFYPVFHQKVNLQIYFPDDQLNTMKETIFSLFNQPLSPIENKGIRAGLNFIGYDINQRAEIIINEDTRVAYIRELSHPVSGVILYRIYFKAASLVFATDVESPAGFSPQHIDFIANTDFLIHDSQYFDEDYYHEKHPKKGFGHSTISMAVNNAMAGQVKELILFHYAPNYEDSRVKTMKDIAAGTFKRVQLSREQLKINIRS
jgi:ribonuclease BN (tRNA processing enzyme)